jgi:hypothetical protein
VRVLRAYQTKEEHQLTPKALAPLVIVVQRPYPGDGDFCSSRDGPFSSGR